MCSIRLVLLSICLTHIGHNACDTIHRDEFVSSNNLTDGIGSNFDSAAVYSNRRPVQVAPVRLYAFGRMASLGDLYDARRDQFLELSLFKDPLPVESVEREDNYYTDLQYVMTDRIEEKMDKLLVEPQLKLSVLSGLCSLGGLDPFLKNTKRSSRSGKISIIYSTRTVVERLRIMSKMARANLDLELLSRIEATHVVVGIIWGADVIVSVEDTNTDNADIRKVRGNLENLLKRNFVKWSRSGDVGVEEKGIDKNRSLVVSLYGDISPVGEFPHNLDEAAEFMKSVPRLIKEENDGKGKKMVYILLPVDNLKMVFTTDMQDNTPVKEVDETLIGQFVELFEDMQKSEQDLNALHADISKWKRILPQDAYVCINELKSSCIRFTANFKINFADVLVKYRSGKVEKSSLVELLDEYRNSNYSPLKFNSALENFGSVESKMAMYNFLSRRGANFIDTEMNLEKGLVDNYDMKICILHFDTDRFNISSKFIAKVAKWFEGNNNGRDKRVKYYIKDETNAETRLSCYEKGNLIETKDWNDIANETKDWQDDENERPADGKRQYLLLNGFGGEIVVLDADTFEEISTRIDAVTAKRPLAVCNGTLYAFDLVAGEVECVAASALLASHDIVWNKCGQFTKLSGPLRGMTTVIGENIYFLNRTHLHEYNSRNQSLRPVQDFGRGMDSFASLVEHDGIIYGHKYNSFKSTNITSGWQTIETPMEINSHKYIRTLAVIKDYVCLVGGGVDGMYTNTVDCHNTKSKSWAKWKSMQQARTYATAVSLNDRVIAIGGYNGTEWLDTIEVFDEKLQSWNFAPYKVKLEFPQALSFYA